MTSSRRARIRSTSRPPATGRPGTRSTSAEQLSRPQQRLRGHARPEAALAADELLLDQRDVEAAVGEAAGRHLPGRAGADHDRVELARAHPLNLSIRMRDSAAWRSASSGDGAEPAPTSEYRDADGNVLTLRQQLSPGTIRKLAEPPTSAAASAEDAWQRREEALFERLAVRWEIAGLPIDEQAMLLGRYRMASPEERRWVRETISAPRRALPARARLILAG